MEYNIHKIETRRVARQRKWRMVQYSGLFLLAVIALAVSYAALTRHF